MTARARTRLAALLATSVVVLAGCGSEDDPQADDPNDAATRSDQPTEQPPPSSATPTASDGGSPETVAAPLYFVGETPTGPRLFREFRNVEADNPVDEALALLAAGDTLDPDYRTLLPEGGLTLESSGPDKIVVALPDVTWAEPSDSLSAKETKLAVQQVVYTVQGIVQDRLPVQFTLDGATSPVLGLDTASGFEAAPENNVLAFVNVTEPGEGATVSGTFTATGVANSFEATVPWKVLDHHDEQVLEGFATAEGWGDHLYPWEAQVDVSTLAPDTYTFVAMTDDPSDGEGAGPTEDTKTFTVQ